MKVNYPHSFSLCLLISTPCANLQKRGGIASCTDGATILRCATARKRYGMDREERGQDSLTLLSSPGSTGTLQRRQGVHATSLLGWGASQPTNPHWRGFGSKYWTGTTDRREAVRSWPDRFSQKERAPVGCTTIPPGPFTFAKDKSFERPSVQMVVHLNEYV
jgi:hypothetical protein